MRGRTTGIMAALVLVVGVPLRAQTPTPTPTPGPSPTPTRPPHIYLSDETVANTETTNNQKRPSVAVGTDGNYMIVWNGDAAQQFYFDIKGQLFTRDGAMIGSEFQIDQAPSGRIQYTPDVAAGGNGNYVVVWADFNQTVTDSEVWMRLYDGAANPLGAPVQVNTYTTGFQRLPQVAADTAGKFVVAWESSGQDGDGLGIFGQQFDATGTPVGGEFAVNTYTTGDQDRAAVDMDDQGFTVVFNDGPSDISAREFGAFAPTGGAGGEISVFHAPGFVYRSSHTVRLDGPFNTLFVAEQTNDGSVVARRSQGGSLLPQFALFSGAGGASTAPRVRFGHPPSLPPQLGYAWSPKFNAGVSTHSVRAKQLGVDPGTGGLFDIGREFELFGPNPEQPVPRGAIGPNGQMVAVKQAGGTPNPDGDQDAVEAVRGGDPGAVAVDVFGDNNGNGLAEPDEDFDAAAFVFSPEGFVSLVGLAELAGQSPSQFRSPSGAIVINDATADYGSALPGTFANCRDATGDCYNFTVPGPRPSTHWDEAVVETLSTGVHKTWILHVGESFADVPTTNLFYAFIENLLHNGVTGGGACGGYCPTDGVKRQQMAVFLLKSRYGSTFTPPPATGMVFDDVPISNPFAPWIETLALLGVTGGCVVPPPPALPSFCPDNIVNRQQMAVFLLKTKEGSAYDPPDCAGIFQDVACTPGTGFSDWVEELYNRLITGGCVANPLQYCPTNPTNRQQMAAFLVKNFGLVLYGP